MKKEKLLLITILIALIGCSNMKNMDMSHNIQEADKTTIMHFTHTHGELENINIFTPIEEFLNIDLLNYKDYEVYGHRVMMNDNSEYLTNKTGNIFMINMIPHHEGAIITAQYIAKITKDKELKKLCEAIVTGQTREVKMMQKLLKTKGFNDNEVKGFDELMTNLMSEMMTEMNIPSKELTLTESEILFLENMIPHHRGGVRMAESYLKVGKNKELITLNEHIILSQNQEIEVMETLLKARK